MLRTFWLCGMWAVTSSSPSTPTQTTVTCGLPSGLTVLRWQSGPDATRSRSAGFMPWSSQVPTRLDDTEPGRDERTVGVRRVGGRVGAGAVEVGEGCRL